MSTHEQRSMAVRLQKLEEENDRLREQNAYLLSALGQNKHCPPEWGLTASEARMFLTIEAKAYASRDDLMAAIYWDKDEPAVPHVIHVFMSRLRKKVKPFGIEILNQYGLGFYLPEASRASRQQEAA